MSKAAEMIERYLATREPETHKGREAAEAGRLIESGDPEVIAIAIERLEKADFTEDEIEDILVENYDRLHRNKEDEVTIDKFVKSGGNIHRVGERIIQSKDQE